MKLRTIFSLGAASLAAVGCQSNATMDMVACEEPRPQVCTKDYRPVCGHLAATDEWKTYSNRCMACADTAVDGWRTGACPEG